MKTEVPLVVFGDEWGLHPTSTQHLVRRLAHSHPLLYVNTLGMRPPRLTLYDLRRSWNKVRTWVRGRGDGVRAGIPNGHLYSPITIPFNRPAALRRWNRRRLIQGLQREMVRHGFREPVLLVASPIGAEVVGALGERLVVYYITDQYAALPGVHRRYLEELDTALLASADLIFVTSRKLQQEKTGEKTTPILLPHGVDFDHFSGAAKGRGPIPPEMARLPRPVLGFFGLLAPWVDIELLQHLARSFPQGSVVLIGAAWSGCRPIGGPANLHWLGPRSYTDLPRLAAHFDVALIPFRQDKLTAYVNPLKLLEYLALGLPVVSIPLPDLEPFGHLIYQASTAEEFVFQVRKALHDRTSELCRERFERAAGESWEARVLTLEEHLAATLGSACQHE